MYSLVARVILFCPFRRVFRAKKLENMHMDAPGFAQLTADSANLELALERLLADRAYCLSNTSSNANGHPCHVASPQGFSRLLACRLRGDHCAALSFALRDREYDP